MLANLLRKGASNGEGSSIGFESDDTGVWGVDMMMTMGVIDSGQMSNAVDTRSVAKSDRQKRVLSWHESRIEAGTLYCRKWYNFS